MGDRDQDVADPAPDGDILGAATARDLRLELNGPLSPVVVREVGREETDDLWVVMPMHVPNVEAWNEQTKNA